MRGIHSEPVEYDLGPDFIYRIQDASGRGPWRPGFSHHWIEPRSDHKYLKPWFVEFGRVDRLLCNWEYAGSACATVKQLRRWFTRGEYQTLKKFGYRAVKIDVKRVLAMSKIQVVFSRLKPLNVDIDEFELY